MKLLKINLSVLIMSLFLSLGVLSFASEEYLESIGSTHKSLSASTTIRSKIASLKEGTYATSAKYCGYNLLIVDNEVYLEAVANPYHPRQSCLDSGEILSFLLESKDASKSKRFYNSDKSSYDQLVAITSSSFTSLASISRLRIT